MADNKKPAYFRLMKLRAASEAAKTAPTSGLKGVKLDRERGDKSKSLNTQSLAASERAAAGRTKQSRRDLKPTVYPPSRVRSLPWSEGDDAWEKQMRRGNRGSGTDKLHGGLKIPAISKAKPAFTEVERTPKTGLKKGGKIRMDGTAKPRG